jgi:capsular polysaccharide biosynthesis protein
VEITDYLGVIWRRLWILVLVPVLAAGGAAYWLLKQPAQYQATATVAAPTVLGSSNASQYNGANAPKQFVADFGAAITSPLILNQVAKETGAPAAEIKDGITSAPIGTSSLVQATYKTSKRNQAAPVAGAAASDTVRFLFQTQVRLARTTVKEGQKAVDEANAALSNFYKQTGQVLTDDTYRLKAQQVSDLQKEQALAQASGDTTSAAALSKAIDERNAQLAALRPQVITYQGLLDRKQQALGRLNLLEQNLEQAQAQYIAADPKSVVSVSDVQEVPILPRLIKAGATAFGAGLILAVCLVLLLEVVRRRPRSEFRQTLSTSSSARPVRSRT